MRRYILSDRDFEEFYSLIEKIETENRLKHGHPIRTHGCPECDLQAQYRYYLLGWRTQVMSGDTLNRYVEPEPVDIHASIRAEINRLQNLLPKENT